MFGYRPRKSKTPLEFSLPCPSRADRFGEDSGSRSFTIDVLVTVLARSKRPDSSAWSPPPPDLLSSSRLRTHAVTNVSDAITIMTPKPTMTNMLYFRTALSILLDVRRWVSISPGGEIDVYLPVPTSYYRPLVDRYMTAPRSPSVSLPLSGGRNIHLELHTVQEI